MKIDFPKIVCLCGSTRFWKEFQEANFRETMAGNIVLSVGFFPHAQMEIHGQYVGVTPEQKTKLDELHERKIDLADEVLVLNVDGYVGESTAKEIGYALLTGKPIRFLEPDQGRWLDAYWIPPAVGTMVFFKGEGVAEVVSSSPESVPPQASARFLDGGKRETVYLGASSEKAGVWTLLRPLDCRGCGHHLSLHEQPCKVPGCMCMGSSYLPAPDPSDRIAADRSKGIFSGRIEAAETLMKTLYPGWEPFGKQPRFAQEMAMSLLETAEKMFASPPARYVPGQHDRIKVLWDVRWRPATVSYVYPSGKMLVDFADKVGGRALIPIADREVRWYSACFTCGEAATCSLDGHPACARHCECKA